MLGQVNEFSSIGLDYARRSNITCFALLSIYLGSWFFCSILRWLRKMTRMKRMISCKHLMNHKDEKIYVILFKNLVGYKKNLHFFLKMSYNTVCSSFEPISLLLLLSPWKDTFTHHGFQEISQRHWFCNTLARSLKKAEKARNFEEVVVTSMIEMIMLVSFIGVPTFTLV